MKIIKLDVFVKNETNHVNGSRFKSYSCKGKDGTFYSVRFTKQVDEAHIPTSRSILSVHPEHMSIDRRNKIPKIWINCIDGVEVVEQPIEDPAQYFECVESDE